MFIKPLFKSSKSRDKLNVLQDIIINYPFSMDKKTVHPLYIYSMGYY